jgi:NADPH:quinone reductase-like Zn-dependent oxidoreductase
MRSVVLSAFGDAGRLRLEDRPLPEVTDDRVLVSVKAASVNSWDWDRMTGRPFWGRLVGGGLRAPKNPRFGCDLAGVVDAVGPAADEFSVGDEVIGDLSWSGFGAFAEYAAPPQSWLAAKSSAISFEEAAAVPQAGLLALQAIRLGEPKPGESILINGAGGGSGTFAIQLAKSVGATVTGVDHAVKEATVRSLGAEFIDFVKSDYTSLGLRYDLVIDMVARKSPFTYRRVLERGGRLVVVGGTLRSILGVVLLGGPVSTEGQTMRLLRHKPNRDDLEEMNRLIEAGTVSPIIDKVYPLEETAEALRHVGELRAKGKVVIRI